MKRFLSFVLIGLIAALTACSSASKISKFRPGDDPAQKLRIAVVDFKNQTGDPSFDGMVGSVSGLLIDDLQKIGSFRLIERQRLDTVLSELKLNMAGLVEPSAAKQVGKQLGVDAFLFGDLSSVKYSRSKQTIGIMWTESQRTDTSMDARLVDVETGEILSSSRSAVYVKQRSWVAFWIAKLGHIADRSSIVQQGIELGCRQLAVDLSKQKKS